MRWMSPRAVAMIDLEQPDWPAPASVKAFVTSRKGGVSKPPYDALNLAAHVGDEREAVEVNRALLSKKMELPSRPVWLNQVHSNSVIQVGCGMSDLADADGSFTREVGVVLAILVADCLPVFLCSLTGKEIAVIHAGWRGLAEGVIQQGIKRFSEKELMAWIGPAIGPCHYEIDGSLRHRFPQEFLRKGRDDKHWMLDLPGIATRQLIDAGVSRIFRSELCTYCNPDRFYSFRRDDQTGRFVALIWKQA